MGIARVALQALVAFAYVLYVLVVALNHLPLTDLLRSPPVQPLLIPTVLLLVAVLALELALP